MTQPISRISDLKQLRATLGPRTVGFVPTMGALHQGHAELLKKSKAENDFTILSVFVNPTQFNNANDLEKYPRTLEADLKIASAQGVDVVWTPDYEELYPDNYRFQITENSFSKILCGAHRPGHFDGVLSVVMKLLQVTQPTRAYFGEKDYQQYLLIRDMAQAFFLDVEIKGLPTIREPSGLAMSSRNVRLTEADKKKAPLLYKIICESTDSKTAAALLQENGFRVDYVEDLNGRRFAAAFLGDVRLIDNVKI